MEDGCVSVFTGRGWMDPILYLTMASTNKAENPAVEHQIEKYKILTYFILIFNMDVFLINYILMKHAKY